MRRYLLPTALVVFCSGHAAADQSSCGEDLTREQRENLEMEKEERAAKEGDAQGQVLEAGFREEYADDMASARKVAEDYAKAHPPPPKQHIEIVEFASVMLGPDNESYVFSFHYTVAYIDRLRNWHRAARFDQNGALIADRMTPWGNAVKAADALTEGVNERLCRWAFDKDAYQEDFPTEVVIYGRDGEDGPRRKRAVIRFNTDGIAYEGERFGPDGKRSGAFRDDELKSEYGGAGGELAPVPAPRIVTGACEKCQKLADARNDAATRAIALANDINSVAAEFNRGNKIAIDHQDFYRAGPALRDRYNALKARYDAAMAEMNAAHDAYMACDRICRPPAAPAPDASLAAAPADPSRSTSSMGSGLSAGVSVGYRELRQPALAFLGREATGAAAPTVGLAASDRTFTGEAYGLTIKADIFGTDSWLRPEFGLEFYDGETRVSLDRLDLAGDRLVIPGLGVGANGNGFSLGYFGGLNSLTNVDIRRDYEEWGVDVKNPFTWQEFGAGYEAPTLYLGPDLAYRHTEEDIGFDADIPGFARDVSMRQTIEADSLFLGAQLGFRVPLNARLETDGGLTLGATITVGAQITSAEGEARLNFTGFAEQFVDDELDDTSFAGGISAYIEAQPAEFLTVFLTTGYHQGKAVVWDTPGGGEKAHLEAKRAETLSVFFGTYLRF